MFKMSDKEENVVYSTKDYKKFSILESNRDLRLPHVEQLKKSISLRPLKKPIDVNERFEIIDGQHRFFAWQELGMPIIYIIHKGWGKEEVPILNTNQKNWTSRDYVKMYSEMGLEDYKLYDEFLKRYGFTHRANLMLLGSNNSKNPSKDFEEGKLEIKKWNYANIMANHIIDFKEYYDGFKRSSFVSAYLQVASLKGFSHSVLMQKVAFQSRKVVHCTTVAQYVEMLKEIYNYRNRNPIG